jgi:YggT family protein
MYVAGDFIIAIGKVLDYALTAYWWIVIIRAVLSWINPDPNNPIVRFIYGVVDPVSYRISRIIPTRIGMIDIAPLILLAIIYFLQHFLVRVIIETGARLT